MFEPKTPTNFHLTAANYSITLRVRETQPLAPSLGELSTASWCEISVRGQQSGNYENGPGANRQMSVINRAFALLGARVRKIGAEKSIFRWGNPSETSAIVNWDGDYACGGVETAYIVFLQLISF
jgi:hypothetical protein